MTPAGQVTAPVDGPTGGPPARAGRLRSRADTLRARRTPFVQATVVRAVKPTSAKAGDQALVLPDGTIEGFVGGTCAESSVRVQGMRVLRAGEPVVLRIIPGDQPPGGGNEAVPAPGEEAEGVVTVSNPCASGGMLEIFLEGVFPPPLVQVSGDAPIARALHRVGAALGYDMRDVSGAAGPLAPDAAAVVVASHGRDEEPVLTAALRAGVPYVGLVASKRRGSQVAAALDLTPAQTQRLHTPAGLDIGSRTPEEIALSIFAEIIAERSRSPRPPPSAAAAARQPEAMPPPADAAGQPGVPLSAVNAAAGQPGAASLAVDAAGRPPGSAPRPTDAAVRQPGAGLPSPDAAGQPGAASLAVDAAGRPPGGAPQYSDAAVRQPGADGSPGQGAAAGEATDPVCGMTVAVSQPTPHLAHDRRMWYFCGPGCRQAFADDPARYQT